ncbi:ATP-grasp domain-containing protein [Actinorhabdospora filicis]|uniref:ATP-grasp domain-containing protein n=1 Tax=Actinorhabdospora filicis TaxID=1785913 RepID=A0A9W6SR95_9ACTN|nr:ATP-grasp domain-containing protein [Actinorhabdospora filicis]GLZ81490.1 ATP-grasp domain-containing protein [Actinorhabdospora filicis]
MTTQKHVAIVDVYAPNRRLAPAFREAGYRVVRVQSTPDPPLVYRAAPFDLSPYEANIAHDGDLAATVAALSAYAPEAVIAGGELGVELADALSEAMGTPGNGTALSPARRDKYVQIETLRAAGLRATRQILVPGPDELAAWHRELGGRIVVKPVRSAAGDGVSFCDTPEEAVAAYHRILAAENVFSEPNRAVVAQEYLWGGEYVVNTVSRDGQHHVTDLWKYENLSANGIPDLSCGVRLLPRHGAAQDAVVPYALEVLDALGIAHGAAHLEIKLTPEGPCLVEGGARMAGFDTPFYAAECIGEAQKEWLVDAYVRPERFAARWKDDYELKKHFVTALMVSTRDAELVSYPLLGEVERLESLFDVRPQVRPGGRLRRTVDDMTTPFIVNLCHPVEEIVDRDFGTLRYLDGPGFYELAES